MMKETIMVIGAHNDDHIIGAGGTLAKYSSEKKKVVTVIFSFGEASHPWQQGKITAEVRKKETEKANKVLGVSDLIIIGLKEGHFEEQIDHKKLKRIIKKHMPDKIFTHSKDDPHPDHKAVHKITLDALDNIRKRIPVYSFDVWNPINIRERQKPRLVVDISETFSKKISSFRCHKSQKPVLVSLSLNIYAKAIYNGLTNDCKYAEIFYKIR